MKTLNTIRGGNSSPQNLKKKKITIEYNLIKTYYPLQNQNKCSDTLMKNDNRNSYRNLILLLKTGSFKSSASCGLIFFITSDVNE